MTDAISRSAVLKVLEDHSCFDLEYYSEYEAFKEDIENLPALDVAPVVRCVDCLYATPTFGNNYIRCAIWGEDIKNDGYCFCGKRRAVKKHD